MCTQNLDEFSPFILKILNGNEILTSVEGRNSAANLQRINGNNPNLYLVNIDMHTKFSQRMSFGSQDIE